MIYEFEKKEGFYLISELEKLRKKKRHDKLIVKCDEATNVQVKNFKRMYILDSSVNTILGNAQHYYMLVNNNNVIIYLSYDNCMIAYCLRTDTDWKIISVEFLPISHPKQAPLKNSAIDRILASTLTQILSFSYSFGFSKVFDTDEKGLLQELFTSIIHNKFSGGRLLETESQIQAKIVTLLAKHKMKNEFVQQFMKQSANPSRLF